MTDEYYMNIALKEAQKAEKNLDVPVGAVIVKDDKIIAKAYNKKDKYKIATYHAEILCIDKACKRLGTDKLDGLKMYVTLEPCIMCLGASMTARIDTIYFGAYDSRYGVTDVQDKIKFNHKVNLVGGIKEKECSTLITNFFEKLRRNK